MKDFINTVFSDRIEAIRCCFLKNPRIIYLYFVLLLNHNEVTDVSRYSVSTNYWILSNIRLPGFQIIHKLVNLSWLCGIAALTLFERLWVTLCRSPASYGIQFVLIPGTLYVKLYQWWLAISLVASMRVSTATLYKHFRLLPGFNMRIVPGMERRFASLL